MTLIKWEGVFPAVTTKFDYKNQLDFDAFGKNLDAQMAAGVHGVVLGGTLGEASTIQDHEKEQLVKFTLEKTEGRIPVVLNIAEGSTDEAVRKAEQALSWGVNGLMLLPPMRYKPDERELITYLRTVCTATDLPVMIYNNPVDYNTEVSVNAFHALVEIPQVQAVKESTRDISNVSRMISAFGDRYSILCGVDTLAMEELLMGAKGWVAGLVCAFPVETMLVYNLVKSGRLDEAGTLYRWFLPLLELDIRPKLVQYIKLAESITGIGTEYVRAPRLQLSHEERSVVSALIHEAIENKPDITF
jgi:1-pyrroline-4-hydroxy-2-carboxylate deaminase